MMIMNCMISADMEFRLVCLVRRYKNTPADRIKLVEFYESNVEQAIYWLRSISIEPLIGHIKSVFRIDLLPVRGYDRTCASVLLSVLLYQILVYYNCKTNKYNPMVIKNMLRTSTFITYYVNITIFVNWNMTQSHVYIIKNYNIGEDKISENQYYYNIIIFNFF
jgi:hypothetical protein